MPHNYFCEFLVLILSSPTSKLSTLITSSPSCHIILPLSDFSRAVLPIISILPRNSRSHCCFSKFFTTVQSLQIQLVLPSHFCFTYFNSVARLFYFHKVVRRNIKIHLMTDSMYQDKKEEEDSQSLGILLRLQQPITAMSIPVGWGCRIHQLFLCRGVRPHSTTSVLDMLLMEKLLKTSNI